MSGRSRFAAAGPATIGLALAVLLTVPGPARGAELDPASARNRGAALLDTGETGRAIEVFRDLVKKLPASAPERVNLGIALVTNNDLDGAEPELRRALEIDPGDLRARYNLGVVLKRRGKNELAAEALAAVAATPEGQKDATVQYNLGVVYKRLRKGEDALAALRRAVALRPEHASAHFQIYNELVQRGDKVGAAKELDLFKLLQKATPDFQRMETYLERGRFTEIVAPGPRPPGSAESSKAAQALPVAIRFEVRAGRASPGGEGSPASPEGRGAASAGAWACAALADLDGDGGTDLVAAPRSGALRIFRQLGAAGQRSAETGLALPPGVDAGCALAIGDVDNDGDLDLFVSTAGGARLYRNEGKAGFTDATKDSGLDAAAGATDALWRDVDRDGDLDLVLAGRGGSAPGPRIFLNASVTSTPPEAVNASSKPGAAAGNAESAEGSALPRAGTAGGAASTSAPRFLAAGPEANLPARGDTVAASDFAGRSDQDLAFASADGSIALARNLRAGRFAVAAPQASPLPSQGRNAPAAQTAGSVERIETTNAGLSAEGGATATEPSSSPRQGGEIRAGDLDGDGFTDLVVLAHGDLFVLWNNGEGGLGTPSPLAEGIARGATGLALLDADGDGDLDLATTFPVGRAPEGEPGSGQNAHASAGGAAPNARGATLAVLRNEGGRRFSPLGDVAPPLPAGAGSLFAADLDGDDLPDLALLAARAEGPLVLANATKSANRFLRISLRGTKSNRTAVGARIQVRAERLVVTRECDGGAVLVGIGARARADAVRVVWPTGVTQDLVDVGSGLAKLEERREFAGSCPFLYAFDGDGFRFIGEALSGAPVGFLRLDGSYERARPVEHLRLPPGLPAPSPDAGGRLSLRMTEEMRELTAIDSVRLVAVDHPASVEVYSNERLREAPDEPFRFLAIGDLRGPIAAAEVSLPVGTAVAAPAVAASSVRAVTPTASLLPGEDRSVLARVMLLDSKAADGFAMLGPRLEGLAAPHALVLEFEGKGSEPRARSGDGDVPPTVKRFASTTDRVPDGAEEVSGRLASNEGLALVLDGWVSWTTSDVSRALYQARLVRERRATVPTSATPGPAVVGGTAPAKATTGTPAAAATGVVPARPERAKAHDARVEATGARAGEVGPAQPAFAGVSLPEAPQPWGPALEVRAAAALAMEPDLGLPVGPTMVAPLPLLPDAATIEVRLGMNLAVYYDRVRLGRIVQAALTQRELAPVAAELRWRGVAAARRHQDAQPPHPSYEDIAPSGPFPRLPGETTPPGDVLPLLESSDGCYAVIANGDEVALEFDPGALPPLPAGFARTWFLVSTGYARDGDPNTEPFPWGTP